MLASLFKKRHTFIDVSTTDSDAQQAARTSSTTDRKVASPYRSSNIPASRSSPDVSLIRSPSTEEAFHSFVLPEPLPSGTPSTTRRGILREGQAPGTGNSVRFFSRDNIRIISPAPSPDVSHSSMMFADARSSPVHRGNVLSDISFNEETGIDQSLAIGLSSSSSSVGQASLPSQFAHRSQIEMPSTPLIASTASFLNRIRDMSPSTPEQTTLGGNSTLGASSGRRIEEQEVTLDMLSTAAERANRRRSTTPTGSPAVYKSLFPSSSPINRNSPLAVETGFFPGSPHRLSTIPGSTSPRASMLGAYDGADESFSSLPSMDFPSPPEDMSNLMGDLSRQPGMEVSDSNFTNMEDGDDSRTTRGAGEETLNQSEKDASTRMSSSFPYLSMESSVRSSCDGGRLSSDPFRTSSPINRGDRRESASSTLSAVSSRSQNTITEAIDYYSQPSSSFTPPRLVPSPQADVTDVTIYHTPGPPSSSRNRAFLPSSSSGADLTIYHTPRSANSLHFASISFSTPRTGHSSPSRVGGVGDLCSFNPADASFSRAIVEKGITPGQVGSPSFYFNLDELSSPSALRNGEVVLVPSLSPKEVLALNSEFYEAQQQLVQSSQAKYGLQLEISKELEASLAKRDAELKAMRAQLGEVRDLEVRLEAKKREIERVREERDAEREKRGEVESGLEEARERYETLEARSRDREIREVGADTEAGGEGSELVTHLRQKLSERELSLWEVRARLSEQEEELETARADNGTLATQVDALADQVASLTDANASLVETVAEQDGVIESLSSKLRTQDLERIDKAKAHHVEVAASRSTRQDASVSRSGLAVSSNTTTTMNSSPLPTTGALPVIIAALRRDLSTLTAQAVRDQAKIKMSDEELENQWKRADETYDETEKLKHHRNQLQETVSRLEEDKDALDQELIQVSAEKESLLDTQDALIAQRDAAIAEKEDGGASEEEMREVKEERDDLLEERDRIVAQRDEAWGERDELHVRLEEATTAMEATEDEVAEINERMAQLSEEMMTLTAEHRVDLEQLARLRFTNAELVAIQDEQGAKDRAHRERLDSLSTELSTKDDILKTLKCQLEDLDASRSHLIKESTLAFEQAQEEGERHVRDLSRTIKDQTRRIASLEKTREEERRQYEEAIAERASAEMEAHLSGSRLDADSGELEKLSQLIAHLRSEDAKKEVTIMRLNRAKMELTADLESSQIALESKQQEVELVKRKFGVRGVAGSAPASNRALHSSTTGAGSSTVSRRQSIVPSTPAPFKHHHQTPATPSTVPATPSSLVRTAGTRPRSSMAMGTPIQKPSGPPRSRSSMGVASTMAPATTSRLTYRTSMDAAPTVSVSGRPRFSLGLAPQTSLDKISSLSTTDDSPTLLTRSLKSATSASNLKRSISSSTGSGSGSTNPLATSNSLPQVTPRRAPPLAMPSSRRTSVAATPGGAGAMAPPNSTLKSRVNGRKAEQGGGGKRIREERDKENEGGERGREEMLA